MSPILRTSTRLGTTLVALAAFVGCADAPNDAAPEATTLSVGEMHNLGMAFVLEELERAERPLSRSDAVDLIRNRLDAFAAEHGLTPMTDEEWEIGLVAAEHGSVSRPMATFASATLAPRAPDFMWELHRRAVASVDAAAVAEVVDDVLRDARSRLPADELGALEDVGAVAAHSASYWERNAGGWLALCDANPGLCPADAPLRVRPASTAGPNGWAVLAADVTGGIMGGPWGALIASTIAALAST